jgi:hypothetical protein
VASIYDPLTGQRFPGDVIPTARMDAAARAILNLLPLPQTSAAVNNFTYSPDRTQDDDSFDLRIDHQLNARDLLFGRYSFNNTTTLVPERFPAKDGMSVGGGDNFPGSSEQRAQQLGLGLKRVWTQRFLLEIKGGYSRYNADTVPTNFGINVSERVGIPGINVDADSSGLVRLPIAGYFTLGDATFIPLLNENTVYQALGNLHYLKRAHSFKVGADFKYRRFFAFQSPQSRGQFSFNGNFSSNRGAAGTGNAIASFLLGYPSATIRNKYLVEPTYVVSELSAYLQDDWRATTWLTLNLGLRYDDYPPLVEADDQIANVDLAAGRIRTAGLDGFSRSAGVQADHNDISPRAGVAVTLSRNTVLRGGYALAFTPPFVGSPLALRNPPFVSLYSVTPSQFTPANRLSDGLPALQPTSAQSPTGSLTPVSFDLKTPFAHQVNLTLQRELPGALVATVGFVGVFRRDELTTLQLNNPPPGEGDVNARRPFRAIFPDVGGIGLTLNGQSTDYRAMNALLERRFSAGWGARAAYTLAKSDTTLPNGQYPFSQIPAGANPFPSLLDFISEEKGPSGQDTRHRLTMSLTYELPFLRGATGMAQVLGSGWQVNLIAVLQSGTPFTITNASPRANTGAGDRPNQIADPVLPSDERTITQWFNTAAFAAQPLFTLGNVGVNTLYGPGLRTFDLSVFKTVRTGGSTSLQFRVETFNLFNRANFTNPNSTFGNPAFGTISSTGGNRARNVQLAAKLLF